MKFDQFRYRKFGVKILETKNRFAGDEKCVYYNKGFPFKILTRWMWYFDYLASLNKVRNPRKFYKVVTFDYPDLTSDEVLLKKLNNAIRGVKTTITRAKNAIKKHEALGCDMFPEENPLYKKVLDKISRKEKELEGLEAERTQLKEKINKLKLVN